MRLEQRVTLCAFQVFGDHFSTHLLRGDLRHPAQLGLGLGRVAQQGFDLGGAEIARVHPHHHIANLQRRSLVARDAVNDGDLVDALAFKAQGDAQFGGGQEMNWRTEYCTPVAITKSSGVSCCSIIHCMRT